MTIDFTKRLFTYMDHRIKFNHLTIGYDKILMCSFLGNSLADNLTYPV